MLLRRHNQAPITLAFQRDFRTAALVGFYTGAIYPFLGRIARGDLHCTPLQLSLMMAAPFIGNLFSPVWAQQMEGKAKMPFAVLSWIVGRGLLVLMAFVTRSWPFVIIVSLSAVIMTVSTPAYVSIMKDMYPDHLRGRLMAYIRMGLSSISLVTALVVGRLLDQISYRWVFPVGAVIGVLAALSFSQIIIPQRRHGEMEEPDAAEASKPTLADTFAIFRDDRNYRWFSLSLFVYGFGNLLVQPLYTLFQVDTLHITNTQVANMANLSSIIAIMGYVYWGKFLDRKGALTTVLVSTLMVGLINVVYLFATRVEHLYLAAIISGGCFAGVELSYLNAVLTFADRNRIAQYQSIHSALLGIRGTLAPFLGPVLMGWVGMRGTFGISLGMILLGAAMQYFGVTNNHVESGFSRSARPQPSFRPLAQLRNRYTHGETPKPVDAPSRRTPESDKEPVP